MSSTTRHNQKKARAHLRGGKKHEKGKQKADINVTPLVDVVLVLLIIFMVVTPMIAGGVAVDLPRTANHEKKPDDGKDIIVSVTATKNVYFAGHPVAVEDLAHLIDQEKRRFPEKTVFLKGDKRATYGSVREVMEAIHKTGVKDIKLGTEEIEQTSSNR
jgi:biopolymer transport protein ExbD/biopolymer transport protein TolR